MHGYLGYVSLQKYLFQVPAGDVITQVDVGVGYFVSTTGPGDYVCYLQFYTRSATSAAMSSTGCQKSSTVTMQYGLAYIAEGAANGYVGALQFFYNDGED